VVRSLQLADFVASWGPRCGQVASVRALHARRDGGAAFRWRARRARRTLTRPRTVSLTANALALVQGNSNAVAGDRHQIFLGIRGRPTLRPWRPIRDARAASALLRRRGTCRRLALITDPWTWIATPRGSNKNYSKAFSSGPAAARGCLGGGTSSARQRSAAGDAGVSARSCSKVCAL
jgi:hypothetical protein